MYVYTHVYIYMYIAYCLLLLVFVVCSLLLSLGRVDARFLARPPASSFWLEASQESAHRLAREKVAKNKAVGSRQ